jgi:predicted DCC family thiol-disulfide oxidoreductase YuxK
MADGASGVDRPLLIFDGDCGFCRHWIARWQAMTGDAVDYAAASEAAPRFPDIPAARFHESVVLVEPDGRRAFGAEAVLRALRAGGRAAWLLRAYEAVPGVRPVAELAYSLVASHRVAASRLTSWMWGPRPGPSTYAIGPWLFMRLLGVTFLAAFASLGVQVHGLIGRDGVLPIEPWLVAVERQVPGAERFVLVPTLCWLDGSDAFLGVLCWGGAGLSLLLVVGVLEPLAVVCLWAAYLSLVVACRTFLTFQWDILLLETAVLAVFVAPLRVLPARPRPVSALARWLLWWLLFRLMFLSGLVKLTSGDPTWRDLTAMQYHHFTQPLPTWVGWWLHQLPPSLHRLSVAGTFVVELLLPLLIFLPRRPRHLAAPAFVGLMVAIGASGNYGFFGLLTAALCVLLLDDDAFPARVRAWLLPSSPAAGRPVRRWAWWVVAPAAVVSLVVTTARGLERAGVRASWPRPVARLVEAVAPFHSFNAYGLFAVMTTARPEVVIEGTADGQTWVAYELPYKAGDPARRPGFVGLHMPRFDWRMWFAALGDYRASPWLVQACRGLLEGRDDVESLFVANPFPDAPPRQVRLLLYDYRFTTRQERARTGEWWAREPRGLWAPVLSSR